MTEVLKYSKIGKEDLALKSSATDTTLRVTLPDGTEVVLTKLSLDEFKAWAAVNFNLQQAQSLLLEILTANPSTNTQGRFYLFNTTVDVIRYMDGSAVRELVELAATQTLTNKTLTSPRIGTAILDTSGNEILGMIVTASAVNYVDIVPSATGQDVIIRAVGDNTNIDLDLQSKGTGIVMANGAEIASFPVGNQGEILFYNGTAWVVLGTGTSGQALRSQGASANPIWADEANAILTTRGDVLYRNATILARLAAGTSGQFLKTQGSGADPVWSALTPDFTSSQQTVAADTQLDVAHGLGAAPSLIRVTLVCTTDDLGYVASTADAVEWATETSASDVGAVVFSDATNVSIVQGVNIVLTDAGSKNNATITLTSWRWVVRAWK